MPKHHRLPIPPIAALLFGLAAPSLVHAQPPALDWAILDCTFSPGPGSNEVTLNLTIALLESPPQGNFQANVDVFFNGVPWDVSHTITAVPQPGLACPQNPPNCTQPTPPCGVTGYTFKSVTWTDAWPCQFHAATNQCNCVPPGNPVPHAKRVTRPTSPTLDSFFDVFVDLGDLVPETNENNNRFRVPYDEPTATAVRSWGTLKILYR